MSRVRGANQSMFARAPRVGIQRSQFRRDFTHKTTFNTTWLYPIFVDEVLPGDTFNMKMTAFARMSTPIVPIMDNLYMDTFFFFVPNRLVWDDWERFCGQDPESDQFLVPQISGLTQANWLSANGELYRYFGIPDPGSIDPLKFSALFFRSYNLIWNEWFRDQNLQPVQAPVPTDSTDDSWSNYFLLPRNKRHDYFTSALPWPQKGIAAGLSIGGGTYPVSITPSADYFSLSVNSSGTPPKYLTFGDLGQIEYEPPAPGGVPPAYYSKGLAGQVTTSGTSFNINDLRVAFQLQSMQEKDARGGTRYTELIFSHFGVVSPDSRLQRPEYLGGGTAPIVITPIAQTAASSGSTTPLATLAAMGTVNFQTRWIKSFTEHGIIIGLVNVRADLTYQQGIERMWLRKRREDWYWPSLANIGEQVIFREEIYAAVSQENRVLGFGFQERYAEYKYKPSMITGAFRSGYAGNLSVWHLSQYFMTPPLLNSSFIIDAPPMDRVLATGTTAPYFLFDSLFSLVCARPMPMFSVPTSLGRF